MAEAVTVDGILQDMDITEDIAIKELRSML